MFDVSLSELMVIGVIALVVIGPERLPRVARTLGHLLGRLQRYVGQVKADINREMQLDDLKKFQEQMADEAGKIKSSFTSVGDELRSVESSLKESVSDGVDAPRSGQPAMLSTPAPTGELSAPPEAAADIGAPAGSDDWKLPEPLPELASAAQPASTAAEKS